jgi:murein DD-endopeptidase MepM/ murein hydrolase activator NlpD
VSAKLRTASRVAGAAEPSPRMRDRLNLFAVALAAACALAAPAAASSAGGTAAETGAPSRSATGGLSTTFRAPSHAVARRVARRAKAKRRMPKAVKPVTPRPKPKSQRTPAPVANAGHFFPVAGPHTFGGAGARFGAGRAGHIHQGQDVTASTGTPLRAITAGTIIYRSFQAGGAGHYIVLHSSVDGRDYVYMHLRDAALYGTGAPVRGGQVLGYVGATGDATGPHLHFEIWVGGWYAKGGAPIDPLPDLTRWDA